MKIKQLDKYISCVHDKKTNVKAAKELSDWLFSNVYMQNKDQITELDTNLLTISNVADNEFLNKAVDLLNKQIKEFDPDINDDDLYFITCKKDNEQLTKGIYTYRS